MTCKHCGANLTTEKICPYCRCLVEELPPPMPQPLPQTRTMPPYQYQNRSMMPASVKPHQKKAALLLCIAGFFGVGGLHRLYTGKIGTGLLWMFTGGLFGFGTTIDLIMILLNCFYDKDGNTLE